MVRKNMIDDGSYQEKQKLKTRKNFFDFTQKELDEARDKEQEQSRKIAEDNARYGMDRMGPSKKPKQISGKEKEDTDSLAAAIEGKKYVKGMYDELPDMEFDTLPKGRLKEIEELKISMPKKVK